MIKTLIKNIATMPLFYSYLINKPCLRIIMYHGISPSDNINPNDFESHLKELNKYFNIQPLSKACDLFYNNYDDKRPLISLTFDDGLKNNFSYVTPLLEKYKTPATFFLCSDLLSGDDMLWNHEMLLRLRYLKKSQGWINFSKHNFNNLTPKEFVKSCKSKSYSTVINLMQIIRKLSKEYIPTSIEKERYHIMSTKQAQNLPDLIEIGSHTKDHPILDKIENDKIIMEQVIDSKYILQDTLNRKITTFCYPNGNHNKFTDDLVIQNYQYAVTTIQGFCSLNDSPFQIPRIAAIKDTKSMMFSLLKPMRH